MKQTDFSGEKTFVQFQNRLVEWFELNQRDLPWRHTHDAYQIWISEIILQQTQVVQGLDYYRRFLLQFPDIQSLAAAEQTEVLKLWQGLGYYSRARNLHEAAQTIVRNFGGKFPKNHADVLQLKGIGHYTAAAICSFAYNQPFAAIDGNVYRVLARYFGIDLPIDTPEGKREFARLADILLDRHNPCRHNQAMMEFGALQCTPQNPKCAECPFADSCAALTEGTIGTLPTKKGRTHVRERFFTYIFIDFDGKTSLRQRPSGDVWQGLYEFPLIETDEPQTIEQLVENQAIDKTIGTSNFALVGTSPTLKHQLSHQRIFAQCVRILCHERPNLPPDFIEIPLEKLDDFPISRLMEKFFALSVKRQ